LSQSAFAKAATLMPGGVSSPVRAFKAVGGTPIFIREGEGCILKDVDGNSYVDYVASYGPLIAGHANERVVAALSKAIGRGTSFGAPTELETQLATLIVDALPAVEMVRFVNSGTEATMSAIRLARATTGRDLVIKCAGCYHGHVDGLLVQAGSGALTLGAPSSPGIPAAVAGTTLLAQYNDLAGAGALFEKYRGQVAAFIVEPVAGNMGVVPPAEGYLQGLRELCSQHGALLIFDEVMTGFRVGWSGAQGLYGVRPDLTCLGKVIGGGLPVGAYGGSRKLMEMVSPAGSVYQAGTLSGNPLAMSAGLATLEICREAGFYEALEQRSAALATGLAAAAAEAKVPLAINRVGSMLTPFFVRQEANTVGDYQQATSCDTAAFATFFNAMLGQGVMLPPSQFEAWFIGQAHDEEAIQTTLKAAAKALAAVKKELP
jgi:glutamate-1-semialdehyde 2,1-aminomutase